MFIYINKVGLKTLLCFLCKIVYNSVGETFEYRFHVVRLLKYQFVWYVLQNSASGFITCLLTLHLLAFFVSHPINPEVADMPADKEKVNISI